MKKTIINLFNCSVRLAMGLAFVAAVSNAQVINFDVPGGVSGGVNYSSQGAYSDSGHNYWNPIANGGTTAAGTNDDGVIRSAITLTTPSLSTYANNNYGGDPTGPELLFTPFVYSEAGTPYILTLSNVPAGTYNLYLYNMNGSGNGASTKDTVSTVSITNTYNTYATTFVQGADYGVISNIVLPSKGTISISVAPSGLGIGQPTEADFNGLQLIPSSFTFPAVFTPTLNTNEVVVAAATPQEYGAVGNGITDDSAAFQAAMNAVYHSGANGGGVVYVPAGNYAFYTNLTIPTGVTLHGDWQDWTKGTNGLVGTTFKVYYGAGNTNAAPFIQFDQNAALKDVNIWYPNQNPNSITPYPFTISLNGVSDSVVQNVALVNSYQGIEADGDSEWILSTVVGTPLFIGLTADAIADICQTEDIRFSPAVWPASKLTNAPTLGGSYMTWMRANGKGMQIFRLDGLLNINTSISGYNIGLDFEASPSGDSGCAFYNGYVTNCAIAANAQQSQISGLEFSDFTLDGDIAINRTITTNDADAQFEDCQIIGRTGVAVYCTGADWQESMQFQNCTISNLMQLAGPGVFNLVNCNLSGSTQCVISASATRAAFTGCTFSPSQNIMNSGNATNLIIDSRQSISNAMPIVNWTNVMNRYVACKPAKTNLFVAMSYGATGNGTTDDTLAIQNALNAAGTNGGGIVYLSAGNYHTTNTLSVPSGVELRGAYELRHGTDGGGDGIEKGSIIDPYGGQGTTNGPPAVALAANSGLVGMTFNYPNQMNDIAFPPTIQGRGGNIYAIGVQCGEPYIYVDLDTYTCTNHFLDMVDGWALKTGVHVGNGSSGSIVDTHCNPTYWVNNPSGQNTWLQTTGWNMANGFAMSNLQFYVLGNCTELFVKDFVYGQNMFMHCSSEGGQSAQVTAISATCDSAYRAFVFDGAGACKFTDVNPDWLVTLSGGNPGLTNPVILFSETNFQGTVRIFNSPFWGSANVNYLVNGGDIGFELVHLWQPAYAGSQVNGGVFHLINAAAYNDPDPFSVTFGPNAGIAGKTNEFIGCYSYNGCTYINYNVGNPANVWVDYSLSSYSTLGAPQQSQIINFDVPGGEPSGVNFSGQGVHTDSGNNYWNPIVSNGTTPAGTNSDGVTQNTITLTEEQSGDYFAQTGWTNGTPPALESYYAYVSGSGTNTCTLNNVPAGMYNLYLYGINGGTGAANSDLGTTFSVNVSSTSYGSQNTVNSSNGFSSFIQSNSYVRFQNVVVPSGGGTITFSYTHNSAVSGNTYGDFNGLQLVPAVTAINFDVPGGAGGGNYSGQGAFSNPGSNYWNPAALNGTTSGGLLPDGVTHTVITLTTPGLSTYGGNNYGGDPTGPELLFTPFAYSDSSYTLTLNNVSAGTYNLYLYGMNGSGGGGSTKFTVGGISITNTYNANATTFAEGTDYGVISNIVLTSAGAITIDVTASGLGSGQPNEADFSGLQLLPTPNANQPQIVPPPQTTGSLPLSIRSYSASQGLTLQWPGDGKNAGTSGATSQQSIYFTSDLTPPVVWTLVTNTPVLSNGQWIIKLPMGTNSSGFYQLQ
jgi:hypothetical protein